MLAESARCDSRFKHVPVFLAKTRLGGSKPRHFERLMKSFGFEQVEELTGGDWQERLAGLGECLHLWALLRAFNPIVLANHHLIQLSSRQLWMSREMLLAKYPARFRFAVVSQALAENEVPKLNSIAAAPPPSEHALA